ncbi:MAG: FG-GAP repeat protein [Deltaproteobacteria bacterium]|nr:FG-GAP repeat protein [Deltaproteobacteria bacterium]
MVSELACRRGGHRGWWLSLLGIVGGGGCSLVLDPSFGRPTADAAQDAAIPRDTVPAPDAPRDNDPPRDLGAPPDAVEKDGSVIVVDVLPAGDGTVTADAVDEPIAPPDTGVVILDRPGVDARPDSTPDATGADTAGDRTVRPCLTPSMLCGDVCVNVTSDPSNCGGCGAACAGVCSAGRCTMPCPSGSVFCRMRGACVAAPRHLGPLSGTVVDGTVAFKFVRPAAGETIEVLFNRLPTTTAFPELRVGPLAEGVSSLRLPMDRAYPAGAYTWRLRRTTADGCTATSAPWEFFTRGIETRPSMSTEARGGGGTVVDLNQDGYADVVATTDPTSSLGAWLVALRGGPRPFSDNSGAAGSPGDRQWFARAWAVGDVNGDGLPDLVAAGREGRLGLHLATAVTSSMSPLIFYFATPNFSLQGTPVESTGRVAGLGDTNGDGYGDVAFGVTSPSPAVDVLRGRAAFTGSASDALGGALAIPGGISPRLFGESVAGVGDFNGDGFADLVVGAPAREGDALVGQVVIYFGSSAGLTFAAAPALAGATRSFGATVVRAGDLEGDGFQDVAIADPGGRSLYYISGRSTMIGPAIVALEGDLPTGARIVAVGDLDGDRADELLVGAPGVRLVALRRVGDGFSRTPLPTVLSAWGPSGQDLAGAGDLNADGRDDLVVGNGRTLVYFPGTITTLVGTAMEHPPDSGYPNLGRSIAVAR